MQSSKFEQHHFSNNQIDYSIISSRPSLPEIFLEKRGSYINELHLFATYYQSIPNFIYEIDIDCKKAYRWFADHYRPHIKSSFYSRRYFDNRDKNEIDDLFFLLHDDLLVVFDIVHSLVKFLYAKTDLGVVEEIMGATRNFRKKKRKSQPEITVLIDDAGILVSKSLKICKPRLPIEDNYNDDFTTVHQTILKRLLRKNDKGLVLLYGKPGTGKTSYIRHLVASVKKNVIFLPPGMAEVMTNPTLLSILLDNPNSILVIEDAEHIVVDRKRDADSAVSALLNITDGLLSDCLNVQIICTFNTDISKVDSALLRKGRLIARYEFKELTIEKANRLSKKLGNLNPITNPMTLTEVYNYGERGFEQEKEKREIGFRAMQGSIAE